MADQSGKMIAPADRLKGATYELAALGASVGPVRRIDGGAGEGGSQGHRLQPGDSDPNHGRPRLRLDHRAGPQFHTTAGSHLADVVVSRPLGPGDGKLLVVLFPRAPTRRGVARGAD